MLEVRSNYDAELKKVCVVQNRRPHLLSRPCSRSLMGSLPCIRSDPLLSDCVAFLSTAFFQMDFLLFSANNFLLFSHILVFSLGEPWWCPRLFSRTHPPTLRVSSTLSDLRSPQWVVDPYKLADSTDLVKNNPLAIDDDAPWQRHFQDEQFRKQIQQDITRTFPSLEFFRRQQVQEDLLNILFCYARSHPDLSYRQGMHELLAGLYYIVATDAGAASPSPSPSAGGATGVSTNGRNASGSNGDASNGSTNGASGDAGSGSGGGGAGEASGEHGRVEAALRMVNDPAYIAHDAAALFAMVMEVAAGWFAQTQEEVQQQRKKALEEHTPFASPSVDAGAKSIVMVRLERIHDRILKGFDSELYHRLQVAALSRAARIVTPLSTVSVLALARRQCWSCKRWRGGCGE